MSRNTKSLLRLQLDRLSKEAEDLDYLIDAYKQGVSKRSTLERVSRHLVLHQISAASLLEWMDFLGTDIVAPQEVEDVRTKLSDSSAQVERLLKDGDTE